MTLTETATLLHKQLLEQAVPRARELHAYRTAGATAAPEFAERCPGSNACSPPSSTRTRLTARAGRLVRAPGAPSAR